MGRHKHPEPMRSIVLIRVDVEYPRTWFKGYGQFGEALTTTVYEDAARMTWEDAKRAILDLKVDYRDSVWSMRAVREAD